MRCDPDHAARQLHHGWLHHREKARDYATFRRKSTKVFLIVVSASETLLLLLIAAVLLFGESLNFDASAMVPAIRSTLQFLAIMVIGVGLSIITAYYSRSAVAETS